MGKSRIVAYSNALSLAVGSDQTNIALHVLEELKEDSAKYDAKDENGLTPIFLAIKHKNFTLIQALIENDSARLRQMNNNKETPIVYAANNYKWECVKKIADTHNSIDGANYGTALAKSISLNKKEVALALIKAGAPDNFFEGGWACLHWAVYYNDPEMITVLLDVGHNPYIKSCTKNVETPIELAIRLNDKNCIQAFAPQPVLKPGIVVNEVDAKENTLEKKAVDGLCAVALIGDILSFRRMLREEKYNFALGQHGSEGFTLMEYLAIYDKWDMFICVLERENVRDENYKYNEDAAKYIMGPAQIRDLLKTYKNPIHCRSTVILDSLLASFPQNYKTLLEKLNPHNACLDSDRLKKLILNIIVNGELKESTLRELAKKPLFKETVLSYLKGLLEHKKNGVLDEILVLNDRKMGKGLENFFKIPRGRTKVTFSSGTLMHFIDLREKWHKDYDQRNRIVKISEQKPQAVELKEFYFRPEQAEKDSVEKTPGISKSSAVPQLRKLRTAPVIFSSKNNQKTEDGSNGIELLLLGEDSCKPK